MKIEIPDEMIDTVVIAEMREIIASPIGKIVHEDDRIAFIERKKAAKVILKYFT